MSLEEEAKQLKDQTETEDKAKIDDHEVFPKPAVPQKNKTDIEKEQESKLRSKYPGLKGPGSSAFLQKRLSKGQKYFDSGDYNMAKAKMGGANKPFVPGQKLLLASGTTATGDAIPTPDTVPHRKTSIVQPAQHCQQSKFTPTPLS